MCPSVALAEAQCARAPVDAMFCCEAPCPEDGGRTELIQSGWYLTFGVTRPELDDFWFGVRHQKKMNQQKMIKKRGGDNQKVKGLFWVRCSSQKKRTNKKNEQKIMKKQLIVLLVCIW